MGARGAEEMGTALDETTETGGQMGTVKLWHSPVRLWTQYVYN